MNTTPAQPGPTDPQRERMLRALLGTLDKRRRARKVRRALAGSGGGACVLMLVLAAARWTGGSTPVGHGATSPRTAHGSLPAPRGPSTPTTAARAFCELVATRDIASDVTIRTRGTTLVQYIDDEQLLAALNEQRECFGLLRSGSRVAVLDRCVR